MTHISQVAIAPCARDVLLRPPILPPRRGGDQEGSVGGNFINEKDHGTERLINFPKSS